MSIELVLGGYPAKRCPRLVHNDFSPQSPTPASVTESMQQLFDAGNDFESDVTSLMRSVLGADVTVIDSDDWSGEVDATLAAMRRGDTVIVNGRLESAKGRSGAPDVLVRVRLPMVRSAAPGGGIPVVEVGGHASRAGDDDVDIDQQPDLSTGQDPVIGYVPVDVKHHRSLAGSKRRFLTYSILREPAVLRTQEGWSDVGPHWETDALQLAHYTRMLIDLGFHPSVFVGAHSQAATLISEESSSPTPQGDGWVNGMIGGIIGTSDFSDVSDHSWGIVWSDLTEPRIETYSATGEGNRKVRSILERYDHEFAFRLEVAEAAVRGEELVRPIGTAECETCVWLEYCADFAGDEDASFAITNGRLTGQEWKYLQDHGYSTVDQLAELDVEEVLDGFAARAAGRSSPQKLLTAAVGRARMIRDGVAIEPLDPATSWPVVPSADVEVDFDIEFDRDQRIYLWGLRVRDGQDEATAAYDPVYSFALIEDDRAAAALAEEFADKLQTLVEAADAVGGSLTIFHWSHPEISRTRKYPRVASLLEGRTLDLYRWMQQHFRVRDSFSLKDVAPLAGFSWDADDAGGFASMDKIDQARSTVPEIADAARTWCLDYNRDDVAAQAAIRDWLQRP